MHTATNPLSSKNALPRDLRGGGPTEAGGGKTYPVDPKAVERLKAHMATQQKTAVRTVSQVKVEPEKSAEQPPTPGALIPAGVYPAEAIAAAKAQEAAGGRRDIASILTPEVLAVWDRWNQGGMTMKKIGLRKHNGLINVTTQQVSDYLRKYREGQLAPAPETETADEPIAPPAKVETAVLQPDPKPEIEPMPTAVEPFAVERPENLPTFFDREYNPQRPRPGDALSALVQLLNDEQIKVKGSVKLNLEIEFGE